MKIDKVRYAQGMLFFLNRKLYRCFLTRGSKRSCRLQYCLHRKFTTVVILSTRNPPKKFFLCNNILHLLGAIKCIGKKLFQKYILKVTMLKILR